jgi:hypothetical protein
VLHLTNGDCAGPALRAAGVEGEIMPWREVLHDGPVPALPPDELREVRERFLGDEVRLRSRDERLAGAVAAGEPLMLWFEADLYDVLLLVQILERLPPERPPGLCSWGRSGGRA